MFKLLIEILHPKVCDSYVPYITDEQLQALAIAYPDNVTQVREFMFCEGVIIMWLIGISFQHWNCQCHHVCAVFVAKLVLLTVSSFVARNTKG